MAILNLGDGSDGDITISTGAVLQTTLMTGGRSYADGVCYRVNSLSSSSVTVTATPNGIVAGDEIILINVRAGSDTSNYDNSGNYEFLGVHSIDGNTINFTSNKLNNYGDNGGDINVHLHSVFVQRVPNYNNLTIDTGITLSVSPYSGAASSGMCVLKAKESMIIQGTIQTYTNGLQGNNTGNGIGIGFGRGLTGNFGYMSGSGAGYGTAGENSSAEGSSLSGGTTYGSAQLDKLYLGSSGGSGLRSTACRNAGGNGGGIIFLSASTLNISGVLGANGGAGGNGDSSARYAGGGGAGGSILLHCGTLVVSGADTITATGGPRMGNYSVPGYGGAGGAGRIALYYLIGDSGAITQATSPNAYTATISMPFKITGVINGAVGNVRITIHDQDSAQLLATSSGTNGAYELDAPGLGPYDVIAKDSNGAIVGYGNVTAYET